MSGDSAPARRIAIPDWMASAPIQDLVNVLEDARFVGGAVRDTLLGRPIGDLDLATPLRPEIVQARLEAAGFRVVPTGLAHGTVTALFPGGPVEITTLRRDLETDGRHATVLFTEDWAEDAARRDFTMNALYLDRTGGVWDPTGQGIDDCLAGRVRFVGDPGRRIEEDYLRILRYYRFQAHYGKIPIDGETRLACCRRADTLARLSGERIRDELLKLLAAGSPMVALTALVEDAIWRRIGLPQPVALNRLARLIRVEPTPDPLRRLASLLRHGADSVADRLRFSKRQRARLESLVADDLPAADAPVLDHHRALYRLGPDLYADLALLAVARGQAPESLVPMLAQVSDWRVPTLPIRGRDLLALGMTPGPIVSAILALVEAWWVDGDFEASRAACLELAATLMQKGG